MAGFGSPRMISELDRQLRVLQKDFVPRTLALLSLFMIVAIRIDILIPFCVALSYYLAEFTTARFARRFQAERTAASYYGILVSSTLSGISVTFTMLALWHLGGEYDRYVAIVGLTGAMLHVVMLRTPHLPMALLGAFPILLSLLGLALLYYYENRDLQVLWLSSIGAMVLNVYFLSGLVSFHRMQAQLIDARQAAMRASETKSRFLATVSHELRTPLNAILGVSQLLRSDIDSDETPRRVVALEQSAQSLRGIVDDVLDLEAVEQGQIDIRPAPSALIEELEAIVDLHRPLAQSRALRLDLKVDESLPPFAIYDPLRVRQCLTNLLNNALKYTHEGSVSVSVGWNSTAQLVRIIVRDTGPGLPEGIRATLFEAGHDAGSDRPAEAGAGLGLAISRGIASIMGGTIELLETSPRGSAFAFTFAARQIAEVLERESVHQVAASPPRTGAATVLIVDDVETNRMITEAFLTAAGYHTICVSGGLDALDMLEQRKVDLVLLDMNMPELSGLETLSRMRERFTDLVVVALTADAMPEQRDRYLSVGLDGYIAKPIDRDVLLDEVRERLATARAA